MLLIALTLIVIGILMLPVGRIPAGRQPQGGRLWKVVAGYCLIALGKWRAQQLATQDDASVDTRIPPSRSSSPEGEGEGKPETVSCYNDSFVIQGSCLGDDPMYFITRLGFRGDETVEVWFIFYFESMGYVKIESELVRDPDPRAEGKYVSAAGVVMKCIVPGKTWGIEYNGVLVDDKGKEHQAEVDLTFDTTTARYHSGLHMDFWALAKTMAQMPWNRAYFDRLRTENQTRIEQAGVLQGSLILDGKVKKHIDSRGVRDHSWGKRDWTFLKRHIAIFGTLDAPLVIDGRDFTAFSCSTAAYGNLFKHTPGLWIAGPDSVLPLIENTDMTLLNELDRASVRGPVAEGVLPQEFELEFRVGHTPSAPLLTMRIRRVWKDGVFWYMRNANQPNAYCLNETLASFTLAAPDGQCVNGCAMLEMGFKDGGGYVFPFP